MLSIVALTGCILPWSEDEGPVEGPYEILLQEYSYNPSDGWITSDSIVTFTNVGTENHTVTFREIDFDSGPIPPGESFSTKVLPGTWSFFCKYHEWKGMQGELEVSGPRL